MSTARPPRTWVPEAFEAEFPDGSWRATEVVLNLGVLAGAVYGVVERLVEFMDALSDDELDGLLDAVAALQARIVELDPDAVFRIR